VAAVFLFIVGKPVVLHSGLGSKPESLVAESTTDMAVGKRSEPKEGLSAATETGCYSSFGSGSGVKLLKTILASDPRLQLRK